MGPVFGSGSESCQGSEKEKVIFKFFFVQSINSTSIKKDIYIFFYLYWLVLWFFACSKDNYCVVL